MKYTFLFLFATVCWIATFAQVDDYQDKYNESQYQDEINARNAEQEAEANDPVRIHLSNAATAASNSYNAARQSVQGLQNALDELTNLHSDDTKDVFQYYADKANQNMSDAISKAQEAVDEAETADYEADQADCSDAASNAQNASDHFKSAKEIMQSASMRFVDATGDQDADILMEYLTTAYNDLKEGATDFNNGVADLNSMSDAMQSCE